MKIQEGSRKRRHVNKRVMLTVFALLLVSIWVAPAQSAADLALYKYAPTTAGNGTTILYNLNFWNCCGDIASDVILNDTLPMDVVFISASGGGTYDPVTRNVTWNIGSICDDCGDYRYVEVGIPGDVAVGTVITNTANISTTTPETDYTNNNANAQTTIVYTVPNLALYKYAPSTAGYGKNMTYTLTFYNFGNGTAFNVTLNDTLPLDVDFISASDNGTYDPATRNVTWNIGDVPPGFLDGESTNMSNSRTIDVNIPGSVPVGTVLENTAYISTTTPETDYTDNSANATTTVRTPAPNLALYKYAPASKDHGKNMTYVLYSNNFGDETAFDAVLNDTLPLNVDFISASDGGTYNSTTRNVTWNLGDILPFASDSTMVNVSIPGSVPVGTVLENTAYISTATPEIRYDDNGASATTTVTSSTLPDNVSVEPNNGNSGGTTSVYWGTPVTFSYHSCDSATGVNISIHINDGGPDINQSMTGGPPDWAFTITFHPRHGYTTVTYTVTGCGAQPPVVFNIYIDPAGYIYDVTTGLRIPGATVTLQRFNISTVSWENAPTGQVPAIMIPDVNPLISNASGQYQWDTLPGTYRVHVTAPGYNPADSIGVTVPPPVTDLDVGLTPLAVVLQGKAKGEGWIESPSLPLPPPKKNGKPGKAKGKEKATFDFEAQNQVTTSGDLMYKDHASGMEVKGNVTTLSVNKTTETATFSGTAAIKTTAGTIIGSYTAIAVDNSKKGKGNDMFNITLSTGYTASGTLGGGNIKVDP